MSLGGPDGPSVAPARSNRPLIALMVVLGVLLIIVLALVAAAALRIGPFAGAPGDAVTPRPSAVGQRSNAPGGSERPIESARPTRTSNGTNDPGASPTQRPRPTSTPRVPASPGTALAELFRHVPPAMWSTCSDEGGGESVAASLDCAALDGGVALTYTSYISNDALYEAYNEYFHAAEIDPDSGRCYEPGDDGGSMNATPNRWPAEHSYSVGEQPVGRYVCVQMGGEPVIAWTDDRFDILAVGRANAENLDRFVTYWLNEAGPVP